MRSGNSMRWMSMCMRVSSGGTGGGAASVRVTVATSGPRSRYYAMGLYRLRGTVCYPVHATPVRPSVSRMREIRTSGLSGGAGARPA